MSEWAGADTEAVLRASLARQLEEARAEVERLHADLHSILRHQSAPAILAAHARLRATGDGTGGDG